MRFSRHSFTTWRALFLVGTLTVLHNEVFIYWSSYMGWPSIGKTGDGVTALLVADPQIVGHLNEGFFGFITRPDNYHYLWLTYQLARYHVQPNITLFLGDLMDEGSISTDEQFLEYVQIFHSIYDGDDLKLYIPGDNDVGGEGSDIRTEKKQDRFARYFGATPSVTKYKFLNIVKLSNTYADALDETLNALSRELDYSSITILINHSNIMRFYVKQFRSLLQELNPSLIISAHVHEAHLVTCVNCTSDWPRLSSPRMDRLRNYFTVSTSAERRILYELVVPTCSYRMGLRTMAFGVMQIRPNGRVVQSSLWLPDRLFVLRLYLVVAVFVGVVVGVVLAGKCMVCILRCLVRRARRLDQRDSIVIKVQERGY